MNNGNPNGGEWDEGYDDDDDGEYEDEEVSFSLRSLRFTCGLTPLYLQDTMTEEQRMEEGRRMFQMFAAKMFEQRVLQAYREKVAQERQQTLLNELAEEERQKELKDLTKQKNKEKKKMQKK